MIMLCQDYSVGKVHDSHGGDVPTEYARKLYTSFLEIKKERIDDAELIENLNLFGHSEAFDIHQKKVHVEIISFFKNLRYIGLFKKL